MAIVKNLLIKNNFYDGVRLTIVGSQSGNQVYYYTEASGDRYYYTEVGGTASPDMEAASFNSFISCTMSGSTTFTFDLIPMLSGNSVMIETKAVAINSGGTKGYMMKSFGGFINNGTALNVIGSGMQYDTVTNFTTVAASFTQSGTQSVCLCLTGQTGETLDWDVYINYTKGFHSLSSSGPIPPKPIYPSVPAASS